MGVAGILAGAALVACGSSSDSPQSSGGAGGAAGASSSGGGTSSGGAGQGGAPNPLGSGGATTGVGGAAPECPPDPASLAGTCTTPSSLACPYASACDPDGCTARCIGGAWLKLCAPCSAPVEACPATAPTNGAPCSGMENAGAPCAFDACAADDDFAVATCESGAWHVQHMLCDPGGCQIYGEDLAKPCPASNVCVDGPGCNAVVNGACEPNPCVNQALSCECAGFLCPDGLVCTGVEKGRVLCGPAIPDPSVAIVVGQAEIRDLFLRNGGLYWTSQDGVAPPYGRVRERAAGGGPIVDLASPQDTGFLALGGSDVYFSQSAPGAIAKVPLGGGAPTKLVDAVQPTHLATNATRLFWTGFDPNAGDYLRMMPLPSGAVASLPLPSSSLEAIAVDDENVYAGFAGSLWVVPVAGGASTKLADVQDTGAVAVDEAYVYWSDFGAGTLARAPKGGGAAQVLASGLAGPRAIALDDTTVYFVTSFDGGIAKVAKTGGPPMTITSKQYQPNAIQVDASYVYWSSYAGADCGGIWRAPK